MKSDQLEICEVCGKEISRRAEECPHCGDPKNREGRLQGFFTAVVNLVVAVSVLVVLSAIVFALLQKGCAP